MTTLHIELRDATALAARAAGLLTPQALDRLLTQALRRHEAADTLLLKHQTKRLAVSA